MFVSVRSELLSINQSNVVYNKRTWLTVMFTNFLSLANFRVVLLKLDCNRYGEEEGVEQE